jgi:hypothetical protein
VKEYNITGMKDTSLSWKYETRLGKVGLYSQVEWRVYIWFSWTL